jgi:large subunit ribosomal protein L28e
MVACSEQLVWEIVKNNNSFLHKVNGRSKRSGTMRFSLEKNNLRSISSYKHSGLANNKAVGIASTITNGAVLTTRTASKAATTTSSANVAINKDFKRVVKTIESQIVNNFYRPDLKNDALAKYSAVYRANRVAKKVKKAVPVKRGRA